MSFPKNAQESGGRVEPEIICLQCYEEEEAVWVAQLRAFNCMWPAADPRIYTVAERQDRQTDRPMSLMQSIVLISDVYCILLWYC
jgi:hypothetical protein